MTNDHLRVLFRRHHERLGHLPTSIEKVDGYLRSIDRAFGKSYFDITQQQLELFLDTRKISSRTRYNWLSLTHCFYKWAIAEGLTEIDPTIRIARPRSRRSLPRPAASRELATAIARATPEQACWIKLAAYQGLRCQEIAGLKREDVIEADNLLRVVHGKGAHERILPLHPAVFLALRALPMPRNGWIFTRPMGGKYSPPLLSRKFNTALRDLDVDATAHQLRHWFGTNLYAQTHDLRVVQELMGHSSPTTTSIYVAFDRRAAIEGICGLSLDDGGEAA